MLASKLNMCHTLKYSILGCDYLLQCVHLSIGFFSRVLKIFLATILFIQELDPFFLLGKL
jgi:hypothetical protein